MASLLSDFSRGGPRGPGTSHFPLIAGYPLHTSPFRGLVSICVLKAPLPFLNFPFFLENGRPLYEFSRLFHGGSSSPVLLFGFLPSTLRSFPDSGIFSSQMTTYSSPQSPLGKIRLRGASGYITLRTHFSPFMLSLLDYGLFFPFGV